jgi:hypothetical protein
VRHGEWGQWLNANTKISQRQASTYVAIAKRWESIPNSQRASIFSIREAMKLIAQAVDADEQSPSAAPKKSDQKHVRSTEKTNDRNGAASSAEASNGAAAPAQMTVNRSEKKSAHPTLKFEPDAPETTALNELVKHTKAVASQAASKLCATALAERGFDEAIVAKQLLAKLAVAIN